MDNLMLKRISNRQLRKVLLQTYQPGSTTLRLPHSALLLSSSPGNTSALSSTWHRQFTTATAAADVSKRRPRRKKQKYEKFNEAKLATGMIPTTTSLETPFEYNSGDSLDEYKTKAELSPWTPVPDSVARKIFDRAIPEEDDCSDRSKTGEVCVCV